MTTVVDDPAAAPPAGADDAFATGAAALASPGPHPDHAGTPAAPHPGPPVAGDPAGAPAGGGLSPWVLVAALLANLALVSALVLTGVRVPFLTPALGVVAVLVTPVALLVLGRVGLQETVDRSITWNVPVALLLLMAGGLLTNTIGRWLAVPQPLGPLTAVIAVDVICVGLVVALRRRISAAERLRWPALEVGERRLLAAGAVLVALAVMGANRLNNGAGGGLTLLMLAGVAVVVIVLVVRAERLRSLALLGSLYLVSLCLLLMTSLRGWFVTGHDVQREFIVFQLAATTHQWDMSAYRDAYNACLSITILPTLIQHWVGIDPAYVYKAVFPLFFAVAPVAAFHIAAAVATRRVALVATVFFVSFVTFFQDMPMLNRQAVGFLFLAGAFLALNDDGASMLARRAWFCVFGAGMALAHYSTTYVALGVFAGAFVLRSLITPVLVRVGVGRLRPVRSGPLGASPVQGPRVLTLVPVAVVVAAAYVWVGPVTQSERGVRETVAGVVHSIRGGAGDDDRSSDVGYSLFNRRKVSPEQRMRQLEEDDLELTAERRAVGEYYPLGEVRAQPIEVVEPAMLPLTPVGGIVDRVVDVTTLNTAVRQGSAYGLQVLLLVGLLATAFGRRPLLVAAPEHLFVAVAAVGVIGLQMVAPVLSVEYGLLRTFQQALLLVDVYIVAGLVALLPGLREAGRVAAATVVALLFYASSTGIVPQVLGGYGPQLHLNNAGTYYEIYYLHPEEVAARSWLRERADPSRVGDIQSEVQTDRYTFARMQNPTQLSVMNDIRPALVRQDAYVFLGYANVRRGESTVAVAGDLVTYRYPEEFLARHKDLIYSSGGARVYR